MSLDISFNLHKLQKYNLTPTEYCYLICIYKQVDYPGLTPQQINILNKNLETKGFCKITEGSILLRQAFIDILKSDSSPLLIESWIDDWRQIFPEGVRTTGRPARGDKRACFKKMVVFCKEYPEFSKEEIYEATRVYVFEMSRQNYNYMQCADYFIFKEVRKGERTSTLASMIEDIKGKDNYLSQIENGGGSFHKEI